MPVVPLAAFLGLAWVAEHLIEVIAVSAACGILSVASSIALFRWAERRDARQAARWRLLHVREVPLIAAGRSGLEAQTGNAITGSGTRVPLSGAAAEQPALAPAIVLNFYGADSGDMAARVIRTALPGDAGEKIITEE